MLMSDSEGSRVGRCVKEKNVSDSNIKVVKDSAVPSVTVATRNTREENVGQSSTGPTTSQSGPDVSFASLLKGSRVGRGVKEKNVSDSNIKVVKDRVVPSVTVATGNTREENVGQSSTGPTTSQSGPDVSFTSLLKGDNEA
ncbi:hypothetical protein Tco_0442648 [Tanacetum coccineum]